MKLVRRINNNVIQVNDQGISKIVIGSGIGFKAYPGQTVDPKRIEQVFLPKPNEDVEQFISMISSLSLDVLSVSRAIFKMAIDGYNLKLSQNFIISLADHLQYAEERLTEGIIIKQPLEIEVKQYFPIECKVATNALVLINKKMSTPFPEEEMVSIALHLINSERASDTEVTAIELTELISMTKKTIENTFKTKIDESTISFARFVSHLRYYLARQLENKKSSGTLIDPNLIKIIKEKYGKAYGCAEKINELMMKNYKFEANENETVFLTVHINRLVRKKEDEIS
ncbi:PRD domain-containing protein [Lactobacillus sp. ESL0731]|uniref:PRD domain-containing protein n=1 Tax=unclassified Lactobacillus TaxID=2620435 RepID=UPI0023F81150|nr:MULTISPECIES: PRD domain-containing protein [unclassified Lactobacillus]WEV51624.1 PRD domain-containing protein [Lactobacillus sp. ESL0700]WEV62753.1 PRD domain-containing protein [Lactobacillus sp. ESL0731]